MHCRQIKCLTFAAPRGITVVRAILHENLLAVVIAARSHIAWVHARLRQRNHARIDNWFTARVENRFPARVDDRFTARVDDRFTARVDNWFHARIPAWVDNRFHTWIPAWVDAGLHTRVAVNRHVARSFPETVLQFDGGKTADVAEVVQTTVYNRHAVK